MCHALLGQVLSGFSRLIVLIGRYFQLRNTEREYSGIATISVLVISLVTVLQTDRQTDRQIDKLHENKDPSSLTNMDDE